MGSQNDRRRIGVLGGSFDPVHEGHVHLAWDAMKQAGLHRVILVPARIQPFKQDRIPASGEDRTEMLRLAFGGGEDFSVSAVELEREGVSYTYLTMRALQAQFGPSARLFFITGTDSLLKLDSWRNSGELLSSYSFIVGSRPGYRKDELIAKAEELKENYGADILMIENDLFDISSTEIRERIAAGRPIHGMVPPAVEAYIRERGLYG